MDKKYYNNTENAAFYSNSRWMAKNQIKTAEYALKLLEDERIGGNLNEEAEFNLILDLGCGTGYTTVVLKEFGFNIIGIDLSMDMLLNNLMQQKNIEKGKKQRNIPRILINAPIEFIPIRSRSVNHIISISSFNFVLDNLEDQKGQKRALIKISNDLSILLKKKKENGRVIIEFYPKKENLEMYLNALRQNFTGGLIIDSPGLRKEKKFIILKLKTTKKLIKNYKKVIPDKKQKPQ
ncbi:MAG: class I SAM-dependent methyltransferase [Promethearchaeota archaeon]